MHRIIPHLAKAAGVRLSSRHCVGGHVFDGESIALNSAIGLLDDHSIMHEIGHYVAAAPEQRDLPNYGLGMYWRGKLQHTTSDNVVDLNWLKDSSESDTQEFMAQMLCVYWGTRYNVSTFFKEDPGFHCKDWETYLRYKIDEALDHSGADSWKIACWWDAAIRVQEKIRVEASL